MTRKRLPVLALVLPAVFILSSCSEETEQTPERLALLKVEVGPVQVALDGATPSEVPGDKPILCYFSLPVAPVTVDKSVMLTTQPAGEVVPLSFTFLDNNKTISIVPATPLSGSTTHRLTFTGSLKGAAGEEFQAVDVTFITRPAVLRLASITIAGQPAGQSARVTNVPVEGAVLELLFSGPVDPSSATAEHISIAAGDGPVGFTVSFTEENRKMTLTVKEKLRDYTRYELDVSDGLKGVGAEFEAYQRAFYTGADPVPDFPLLADEDLLTRVQQKTFQYFYDHAHPVSGMARERDSSDDIVTSGGSGFGIMALLVGIERNFITRTQGVERLEKIIGFLETADRFHGAWPHWMNGSTGEVIPFSANDNGGDLVETSFLVQGLLTARQYLDASSTGEKTLIDRINALWHAVEWDWYTRGGQDVLYWHWSPDREWTMNLPVRGYNETLITYFLAAASPTHPVAATAYHRGWAANGGIVSNRDFYNITLPLGPDYGGPLFFAHYSFLGLDPTNLRDAYADYGIQHARHARIHHAYSVANPRNFVGYGDDNWGLTASDNHLGYAAHSPTNDLGVIAPTAALASMPYTPELSMKALKFFYYTLGDRLWGEYGFYDAFNLTEGWVAGSYLAIDQGPVIIMIENYRTGLLWRHFMAAPEVGIAMDKLGFTR